MMPQTLKVKKLDPKAVIPKFATEGAAGMDLTAISCDVVTPEHGVYDRLRNKYVYGTGLAFEIPVGYVGLIFPRSSIHKTPMVLSNCVGVIDSDYRGEVKFVFSRNSLDGDVYDIGDRVGQLVLVQLPRIEVEEAETLSDTARGTGGFGSTGR